MDRRHLVSGPAGRGERRARWGLAALLVWTACSDAPAPASVEQDAPVADAVAASAPVATLALGYAPGPEPTERMIARAQAAVRADPERVAAYDELAMLMMRRARETSNAVYRRYAEDALRAARARDENDAQTMILSALLLQDQHRFAAAAELARRYIAAAPDDSTGHIVLGDALLELGDYEPAMDSYQAAMNLRPDLRSYNRAAHMRWLQGDFDGAKQIMELAIDSGSMRDPEARAWCFVDLGAMYLHRGQAQQAQSAAARALELVPDYLPAIVLDARALARRGDRDAAIERLAPAVDRHATADELLRLAEWLHDAGRTDESAARLAQAERLASAEPRPLALYYARHGLVPQRALALAQAELTARHDLAAHDVHGLALLRAGRPADALAAIDRALALGTKDASLHLHAGLAAKAAGDPVRARAELAAADAIDEGADALLRDELRAALGET
ncbi:MAG TPA: tetratricopeptide repeat protein [Nannocystaceae bacterium]|nr:tetratricopeptide repeat protein [Nannocystaceae bacterium]